MARSNSYDKSTRLFTTLDLLRKLYPDSSSTLTCLGTILDSFHRQLKAKLKYNSGTRGTESVSTVSLCTKAAWKDLRATTADVVYGQDLRFPSEFLSPIPNVPNNTEADFFAELRNQKNLLRPFVVL